MLTYEGFPGEHISTACEEAKEIAKKNRKPIRFDFNGVKIVATGKKSISSMLWEFDLVLGQHSQTYRRSRKYQEYKKKRDREVRVGQAIDCMKKGLPPHPITTEFEKTYKKARQ